jgi:hypothetical protein
VPARLLDEAVDHGEAKPRALADLLGGEEGLERARHRLLAHPTAGVGHADRDILARHHLRILRDIAPVEMGVGGLDGELAALRIASRALIARFRIAFSSWLESASIGHRPPAKTVSTSTVSPKVRWRSSDIPANSRFGSIGLGASGWRREKASSR